MASKKALITGATGFVGSHLVRELCARGYTVRALARPTSIRDHLRDLPIQWVSGDITDRSSVESAAAGIDVIFHIAALFREAKFPDSAYWEVNFEGTRNVLDAAAKNGVGRIVHCSTTGVHGEVKNPPGNEESPYHPNDVYQRSKTEAEKLVLRRARAGELDAVVIRPIMIWGPGDQRILKLFRGIARRRFPIVGSGKTLCHWVLVSDLVRGFILAAETPGISGETFLIGGRSVVTLEETVRAIARRFGVKPLPFKIPLLPVKALAILCEALCRPFGIEPPLYRRRVDFFTKSRAYDCSKAKRILQYEAQHPFEQEVSIIADWYQEQGWV